MNPLLYKAIHFQSVKTYYKWTVHEYKCLFLTFVFLQIEGEREREGGVYKVWVQRRNGPKVTYLIFRWCSTGESFFFHGLIDFILFFFYTGLKNLGFLVSQIFFCLQPRVNGYGSVCHEPCSKTNFLIIYFCWGEGVPTSVLGSQPIIWLLSFPPWCPATWGY